MTELDFHHSLSVEDIVLKLCVTDALTSTWLGDEVH